MKENVMRVLKELKELNHDQLEAVVDGIINLLVELERPAEPQIGDRCIFWDNNMESYSVGIMGDNCNTEDGLFNNNDLGLDFMNCRLLIKEAE